MNDRTPRPRAFTLTELLVVIIIFALVLALAVPAVTSIIESSERAQAENQVRVALTAARSVATSSENSEDSAAVFFFDPGGRLRIVACVRVGQIRDLDAFNNAVSHDVFVPVPSFQAVQLPRGWMVRGYAPPASLDDGANRPNGWYESNPDRQFEPVRGNWVAPETGYCDMNKPDDGRDRQTFMVRFAARTGVVENGSRVPAIVVDPSPSSAFSKSKPFTTFYSWLDGTGDLGAAVRRTLAPSKLLTDADRRTLLGSRSTNTVLARSITEVALYQEARLAAAIGARGVNRATGSLYGKTTTRSSTVPTEPVLDPTLFASYDSGGIAVAINNWIQATNIGSSGGEPKPSDAIIFLVDRYTGEGREVLP